MATTQGHVGKHQGLSGGRGARGKHGHKPLLWFLWGRPGKEGEVDLGLGNLHDFSGF